MPFDAFFISAFVKELSVELKNARIDQIHHPLKDRVVLSVRHPYPGRELSLLFSVHPQFARVHLIGTKQENPLRPSPFCMLLRKYLNGGRILGFEQVPWERTISLLIEVYAPEKGLCGRKLVFEAMGSRSNLLLLAEDGTILDAVKRIQGEREVLPGQPYLPPPAQALWRPDLAADQLQTLLDRAPAERLLRDLLRAELLGVSPFIAAEILSRAGFPQEIRVGDLAGPEAGGRLLDALAQIRKTLVDPSPCLLTNAEGAVVDFSAFLPTQPGYRALPVANLNEAVAAALHSRDEENRRRTQQDAVRRTVKERIAKLQNKLQKQQNELADAEDAEHYRISGELLSIHLKEILKGRSYVDLPNYYDPSGRPMRIALRPDLTPAENAQLYFRKYQKAKKGRIAIARQLKLTEDELSYLQGVLAMLEDPLDPLEIAEVQNELASLGYMKPPRVETGKRPAASVPRRFISSEGIPIDVGRNNLQNDRLTLKIASPRDIWFHTQGIPGSHVLVRNDGRPIGDITLLEAANLAAWFSQARHSTKIPVDYTARKNVKKPPGSRPGFVLYQPFQTIVITPDPELLERLGVEKG